MFRKSVFLLLIFILVVIACKTVPLTGRKAVKFISSTEVNAMSFQQYSEVIGKSNLSKNQAQTQMVKRVGVRIQHAVEKYMHANGHSKLIKGYKWEFNLIEGKDANAWCMPGGKVAFYTGILPVCQDENGIAVVMGHEIAHAIAEHGNERMSQVMAQQLGGVALDVALEEQPATTKAMAGVAFGIGSQYGVMLPFSRLHESEADEMGLYFMAMAGYDPTEAVDFWKRMETMSSGQSPPEFLSTHPANETRIVNLQENMQKAIEYYNKSKNN